MRKSTRRENVASLRGFPMFVHIREIKRTVNRLRQRQTTRTLTNYFNRVRSRREIQLIVRPFHSL